MKNKNKFFAIILISFLIIPMFSMILPGEPRSSQTPLQETDPHLTKLTIPVIEDGFESYTNRSELSAEWTVINGTNCLVSIDNGTSSEGSQSVKLYDNNNSGELAEIQKDFTPQRDYLYLKAHLRAATTIGILSVWLVDAPVAQVRVMLDNTKWKVGSNGSTIDTGYTYVTDQWYKLEVLVDIANANWSAYVDDQLIGSNLTFFGTTDNLWRLRFFTSPGGGGGQTFYIDDVVLRPKHIELENILNGTQLNTFNEKLLLDGDGNSHVIQSTDVDGSQKIAVQYQYNFSERPVESIDSVYVDYRYRHTDSYTASGDQTISITNFQTWSGSQINGTAGLLRLELDPSEHAQDVFSSLGFGAWDTEAWTHTETHVEGGGYWWCGASGAWVMQFLEFPNPNINKQYSKIYCKANVYYFPDDPSYDAYWGGHSGENWRSFFGLWDWPDWLAPETGSFTVPATTWTMYYGKVIMGDAIDASNDELGGTWPVNQYQSFWKSNSIASSLSWDYAHIRYMWYEYYPSAQGTSPVITLGGNGEFKQLNNITYQGDIPVGTSYALEYKALTPDGWTNWQTTDFDTDITTYADKVQLRLTLNAGTGLKQKTPKFTSLTINYADPPDLDSTVSLYNYINTSWDPIITTSENQPGIQYNSTMLWENLSQYFDSNSILKAKVETTMNAPSFNFAIDQLLFDINEPNYHLFILNHTEDNIIVAKEKVICSGGSQVSADLDFNLTVTYGTRVGPGYTTYTNASAYYRINEMSWQGPFYMGQTYGNGTASFLIGEGNYSTNDDLYYYFAFTQYDLTQGILADHYWTQGGSFNTIEDARANAFHKKVGSILYELTLNYSVWYKAQLERIIVPENGNNVTLYPWINLEYQNFTVNFYNTTPSQTNFSASCINESKLNHYIAEDTRNISKFDTPQFQLSDGLNSPFTLQAAGNYEPFNSTILVPLITYDSPDSNRNLTFTGDMVNLTYKGFENWPYPHRSVRKFTTPSENVTLRFDMYTGIMVYYAYRDETINASQKVVIGLIDNNQSYPINLWIQKRCETNSTGVRFLNDTIFEILHDPPGDNSYSTLQSGTTIRKGISLEESGGAGWFNEFETSALGVGAGVDASQTFYESSTYDTEWEWTWTTTLSSSTNSEDPNQIGPGRGDLYYLVGLILQYSVKINNYYIVIGATPETPGNYADPIDGHRNDLLVWTNGSKVEYGFQTNSSKTVFGHQLANYNATHLAEQNVFADNNISETETASVNLIGSLFWTAGGFQEYSYSMTTSVAQTQSISMELTIDEFYTFDQGVTTCVGVIEDLWSVQDTVGVHLELSSTTISTSSTEENEEILLHLEDDDGAPLGQHDQFMVYIYEDLTYNTFGVIYEEAITYSSRPYEIGTKDRRPPTVSDIIALNEYVGGTINLICAANDEETGVSQVKFYYDTDPVFDFEDSIQIGFQNSPSALDSSLFQLSWDTTTFQGTYYLFAVVYDSADAPQNYLISERYEIQIDNIKPQFCQAFTYKPYRGAISLYAAVLDLDSGMEYVEYWDGDPDNINSTLLGRSYDASGSFQCIWATDPNGLEDGLHYIYARGYDRAGNYRDSTPMAIQVDNLSPLTDEPTDWLPIAVLVAGIAIASALVVMGILIRSRTVPPPPKKPLPAPKKGISTKPLESENIEDIRVDLKAIRKLLEEKK